MRNYTVQLKQQKQAKLLYNKMDLDMPCLAYGQQDLYNSNLDENVKLNDQKQLGERR